VKEEEFDTKMFFERDNKKHIPCVTEYLCVRAQRDRLLAVGRDWHCYFVLMSVFGKD
jgi:hypothetical protein